MSSFFARTCREKNELMKIANSLLLEKPEHAAYMDIMERMRSYSSELLLTVKYRELRYVDVRKKLEKPKQVIVHNLWFCSNASFASAFKLAELPKPFRRLQPGATMMQP